MSLVRITFTIYIYIYASLNPQGDHELLIYLYHESITKSILPTYSVIRKNGQLLRFCDLRRSKK